MADYQSYKQITDPKIITINDQPKSFCEKHRGISFCNDPAQTPLGYTFNDFWNDIFYGDYLRETVIEFFGQPGEKSSDKWLVLLTSQVFNYGGFCTGKDHQQFMSKYQFKGGTEGLANDINMIVVKIGSLPGNSFDCIASDPSYILQYDKWSDIDKKYLKNGMDVLQPKSQFINTIEPPFTFNIETDAIP